MEEGSRRSRVGRQGGAQLSVLADCNMSVLVDHNDDGSGGGTCFLRV